MIGQRFGKLVVIKQISKGKWYCKCDCEGEIICRGNQLRSGDKASCGCKKSSHDLEVNQQRGYLTLKRKMGQNWECTCCCGKEIVCRGTDIRRGKKNSCGCQQYNIKGQDKRRQTCLVKYGKEYPAQNKEISKKIKNTCLDRFGVENVSQSKEVKEKIIKTCREKYGYNHHLESPQIRKKIKETIKEKYKTEYISQVEEVKNKRKTTFTPKKISESIKKRKKTCLLKYGTTHQLNTNKKYTILSDNSRFIDICRAYGVAPNNALIVYKKYGEEVFYQYCKEYKKNKTTSVEQVILQLLTPNFPDTTFYNRQPLEILSSSLRRRPDFRIEHNERTVYINGDGLYAHSEAKVIRKGISGKDYHQHLQQEFEKHNLTIFQFREHELRDKSNIVKSIVLNYLGIHEKKYHARKLTIKKLAYQETSQFFEENHLMGTTPSTGFGLYDDQELVSCLSVRWKSKEKKELEIARFASKINVAVRGGFSRLLKHIEREYNPNSIISFCDMRYSTGQSYEKNNFTNLKTTLGFEWTDGINAYNRLKCRANMDDRKLTQEQQAEELSWYKIYDAGQRKYIKYLT